MLVLVVAPRKVLKNYPNHRIIVKSPTIATAVMLLDIQNTAKRPTSPHPILNLGFRVFFLGAAVFSILTMSLWLLIVQGIAPFQGVMNPMFWHGHEMIFGYALAVIAGFLLTAVKTWTGQQMPYGVKLFWVFLPWLLARLLWLGMHTTPSQGMLMAAFVLDVLFWGLVSASVMRAVWIARQMRQMGIIAKLMLLMMAQVLFYVGVLSAETNLQQMALYLALYLVIGVVFTIARRVLPFFISKGIGVNSDGTPNGIIIEPKNSLILDRLNLLALLGFVVMDVFVKSPKIAAIFALLCFIVNTLRLKNWYHQGIWQKPLLWSLVLAFAGMTVSWLIFALAPWMNTAVAWHSLGLHGLALFGIGLMTVSMMARVSLGHTGRSIYQPPKMVGVIFVLMIGAALCRVLLPMLGGDYLVWIMLSQLAWIMSFVLFCVSYAGILLRPRTDGLFG